MQGASTIIRNPDLEGQAALKAFSYDYSYWSIDETNPDNFADQERVFKDLGTNILDNAFGGAYFWSRLLARSLFPAVLRLWRSKLTHLPLFQVSIVVYLHTDRQELEKVTVCSDTEPTKVRINLVFFCLSSLAYCRFSN